MGDASVPLCVRGARRSLCACVLLWLPACVRLCVFGHPGARLTARSALSESFQFCVERNKEIENIRVGLERNGIISGYRDEFLLTEDIQGITIFTGYRESQRKPLITLQLVVF